MNCPHCDYSPEKDREENKDTPWNREGGFFISPVELERTMGYELVRRTLYGCPKCKKVFIWY